MPKQGRTVPPANGRSRRAIAIVAAVVILASAGGLTFAALRSSGHKGGSSKAAATVGSQTITVKQLTSEVDTALGDPNVVTALASQQYGAALGSTRGGFIRFTLSRLISQQLVADVAAAHHVTASPSDIRKQTATFAQQAGSQTALEQSAAQQVGVSKTQVPELIRFSVLQQKISAALTANLVATPAQLKTQYAKDTDTYDQLDIAQIALKTKAQADKILKQVKANPSSFASLAKKYSLDTATASKGGEVGLVGRSQVIEILSKKDNQAKPGSFVLASSSGQFIVLHIESRKTQPESSVTAQLKASLFSSQAQQLLGTAITTEAQKLGIHVNPAYGHWDPTTESVVANSPGGSSSSSASPSPTDTASASTSPVAAAPTKCAAINPNPPVKGEPSIPPVTGKPSSKLVVKDIKVGTGKAAKAGDDVTVKYVGISCSTGKVFDASYTDGAAKQEFTVSPLGGGKVIPGWDEGLVGIKAGGVRELIIPAALAYGAEGSPPAIEPNETLIFVITAVKV